MPDPTNPTPPPWKHASDGWIEADPPNGQPIGHLRPADAEVILRAVNSHDQLIAACEAALDSLEYVNSHHPEATGSGVRSERIAQLRNALRAAGGEEPTSEKP